MENLQNCLRIKQKKIDFSRNIFMVYWSSSSFYVRQAEMKFGWYENETQSENPEINNAFFGAFNQPLV